MTTKQTLLALAEFMREHGIELHLYNFRLDPPITTGHLKFRIKGEEPPHAFVAAGRDGETNYFDYTQVQKLAEYIEQAAKEMEE